MTRCLINNRNAFTLVELMVAVAFSVLLLTGVYGFYNAASQSYSSGIARQTLQDGVNTVINKIMEGETESGVVYRLSTANSYMIPNGVGTALYTCGGAAQAAACNASNLSGEIYFCQDTPCTTNDATARWYYLNSTGTSVIYHHPSSNGGTVEETIYKAPTGSSLTLRFLPATANIAFAVEIDAAMRENLSATNVITNNRLSATSGSGAATTYVLLRDHP